MRANSDITSRRLGFTLVEMLIVMTIVGSLLSLVGPLAIDSLNKAQARSEILTMKNWLNYQSQRAFITGTDIQIQLRGKRASLVLSSLPNSPEFMEFDYLFFQPQDIYFSQHGVSSTHQVMARIVDQDMTIELQDWSTVSDE